MSGDQVQDLRAQLSRDCRRHHRHHLTELILAVVAGCVLGSALVQLLSGHTRSGFPTLWVGVSVVVLVAGVVLWDHRGGAS
ncbi:hypothetical protein AWB94_00930 [Mycolicibacterium canariasense]|nr:hypothetical protein AWB94_00930 [Mycolicibacterium canariasense]